MQEHELVDIAPKNRKFTWRNRRIGKDNIMEWLDRILVDITLLASFSTATALILPFSSSDHYPITFTLEEKRPLGSIPFKYSPLWNNIPEANNIVRSSWSHHIEGSHVFIWESKLKNTKIALKE